MTFDRKAYTKEYYQRPGVKEYHKEYMKIYKQLHSKNPETLKKIAKKSEKNINRILKKHNLSHLKTPMILDGITLDNELKKRNLKVVICQTR